MSELEHLSGLDREVRVVSRRGKVCLVHIERFAPPRRRLRALVLVEFLLLRTTFLDLGNNFSVLANHNFPFVFIANDVRFIDDLALPFFPGDVLELCAHQFALNRLPHCGGGLIEADLGLACLGRVGHTLLHSGAAARSYHNHGNEYRYAFGMPIVAHGKHYGTIMVSQFLGP